MAIARVVLALALRFAVMPTIGKPPLLGIFLPAITLNAWFGALGPGLLGTALSYVTLRVTERVATSFFAEIDRLGGSLLANN